MNLRIMLMLGVGLMASSVRAAESLWIEAELMDGLKGYCWPMGKPEMKQTKGHWGLSGPGWAAEWTQGGESGFLSVACGADDDQAVMTKDLEIPADGRYHVWVRYRDVREMTERFQLRIEQPGSKAWSATYGEKAVVDEDNEMKLYWKWAFGWGQREAQLKKGAAKLSLLSAFKEPDCRQIDVIVLTTDDAYRPYTKEQPSSISWDLLNSYRGESLGQLEPLARSRPSPKAPAAWKPRTFRDKGFLYLWNVDEQAKWAGDEPGRILYPYHIRDEESLKAFEARYGGKKDVPIYSDPRIVPAFHGAGPGILQTDAPDAAVKAAAQRFVRWLDANPDRPWAMMMNYAPETPLSPAAFENFKKYRDRFVGSIAGEDVSGYVYIPEAEILAATANCKTRRQMVEAFLPLDRALYAKKMKTVFGKDLDRPYTDVIPCPSVGGLQFFPLCFRDGARTVGYESCAATFGMLGMRQAFLRGAARQNGGLTATYRSCNFGDSSTLFCETMSYTKPRNILDNFYGVYSGAGMTWYKMDIWYQYMAGVSMFYHEQGFDEFWMPGGGVAGLQEIQLSPKGKLVDRFLRLTAARPDRGTPYTPVAFLVDYAHGWEPSPFYPGEWIHHLIPHEKTWPGDHDAMMREYFFTAYHPIGPKSQEPITGTSETYVPGVFGDIFDVIYAYPDEKRWTTIDTYPVVIVTGDIELTEIEGKLLNQYIEKGGTALIADSHLTGPGLAALKLPATENAKESDQYLWLDEKTPSPSQRFAFRPITDVAGARVLARSADGQAVCAAFERGKGRLIYLSIPRGMGIDRRAPPQGARLFAHLTRGLMPVEVQGEVEWAVNQSENGWLVTLLNPAGQAKPQQGITPTDYRQNKIVTISTRQNVKSAKDRLLETDSFKVEKKDGVNRITVTVLAGSLRIMELRD
jgi:hypothetical protein